MTSCSHPPSPASASSKAAPGDVVLNVRWLVLLFLVIAMQTSALVVLFIHPQLSCSLLRPEVPVSAESTVESPRGAFRLAMEMFEQERAQRRRVLIGEVENAQGSAEAERQDVCYMGGIFDVKVRKKFALDSRKQTQVREHAFGVDKKFLPEGFVPFSELLCQSRSDKKLHFYGHMYSEYLDPLRLQQDEVNLLEIGLRHGDSVNLWKSAFPQGKLYGLDAFYSDPHKNVQGENERIQIFKGDQEDVAVLQQLARHIKREVGHLDFIVDDGGHTMGQQITSFTKLFSLLKPGGVYFIEDLQTSYWRKKCHRYYNGKPYCYGGGPPGAKKTTIDLIKSLIDVMNSDFIEDHRNIERIGSGRYHVNEVDSLVGSVQCWRNMCAIRRKYEGSYF